MVSCANRPGLSRSLELACLRSELRRQFPTQLVWREPPILVLGLSGSRPSNRRRLRIARPNRALPRRESSAQSLVPSGGGKPTHSANGSAGGRAPSPQRQVLLARV